MQECFHIDIPQTSDYLIGFENLWWSQKLKKELNKKWYYVYWLGEHDYTSDHSFGLSTYAWWTTYGIEIESLDSFYKDGVINEDMLAELLRKQNLKIFLSLDDFLEWYFAWNLLLFEATRNFVINKIMTTRPQIIQYLPEDMYNFWSWYNFESLQADFWSTLMFNWKKKFRDIKERELLSKFSYEQIISLLDWTPSWKSFDEMYLSDQFPELKEKKLKVCEDASLDLNDLRHDMMPSTQVVLEDIIREWIEWKLWELLAFLEKYWFRHNPQDDTYISHDEQVVLSFEKNEAKWTVGFIILTKSPSWKHVADPDTFMREYFKTWYKKYDFQKY